MPSYRRLRVPGDTYFLTVTTFERRPLFNREDSVTALHADAAILSQSMPGPSFRTICTRSGHCPKPTRISPNAGTCSSPASRAGSRQPRLRRHAFSVAFAIWQPRYWEHYIRDDADRAAHIDYVHFNPVRHRLVTEVADWPYSTFHRYVREGLYPASWAKEPEIHPPA